MNDGARGRTVFMLNFGYEPSYGQWKVALQYNNGKN